MNSRMLRQIAKQKAKLRAKIRQDNQRRFIAETYIDPWLLDIIPLIKTWRETKILMELREEIRLSARITVPNWRQLL